MNLWTIGHSTLPIEMFLQRLSCHGIEVLADVRRFPGSRRHPQFGAARLAEALAPHQIEYLAFPELGGRRHARPDSRNTAWRHEAFRGTPITWKRNRFGRESRGCWRLDFAGPPRSCVPSVCGGNVTAR